MTALSSLGVGTAGTWTRRRALELLSRGVVDHLVATGVWQSPWPGVLSDGGTELDPVQRAFAAHLASGGEDRQPPRRVPSSLPSHRTAARVWGLPLVDDDDPATGGCERWVDDVHGLGTSGRSLVLPKREVEGRARVLHRHRGVVLGRDVVEHPSGLWLTTPLRTAMDCLVVLDPAAAVCLLDHGLREGLFTLADLAAELLRRAGCPGVARQAAAVAAADARAESPNETVARLVLLPALPTLVPQHRLLDQHGRVVARFNLGDAEVRLGVECDGRRGHAGAQMVAKDQRRDRTVERLGWWTERVVWFEVRRQQEQVRQRVLERHTRLAARAA